MFGMGPMEMIIFGIIAILLFGKRLPEVARSLGKGVTEFKRGLSGVEAEIDRAEYAPSRVTHHPQDDDQNASNAPKFEPPPSEPATDETARN